MLKYLLFCILITSTYALDVEYMTLGKTYPFAEKDMLLEISDYIKNNKTQIEEKWKMESAKMKEKAANYKPDGIPKLPKAKKNTFFYPNMNYTLDVDIPDKDGKILYPKGFTFNPMKYVKLPYTIIVIDATRSEEVEWLKKQEITDYATYRIMITDGSYSKLGKQLKTPIFYAMPKIIERFKLRATPSIITQESQGIKVQEICLGECRL